jgi:hypothetical protein
MTAYKHSQLRTVVVMALAAGIVVLASIVAVYGWGIHYYGKGWLYNVAGLDAVEIRLTSGRRLRIGTDEPEVPCEAISRAITSHNP